MTPAGKRTELEQAIASSGDLPRAADWLSGWQMGGERQTRTWNLEIRTSPGLGEADDRVLTGEVKQPLHWAW